MLFFLLLSTRTSRTSEKLLFDLQPQVIVSEGFRRGGGLGVWQETLKKREIILQKGTENPSGFRGLEKWTPQLIFFENEKKSAKVGQSRMAFFGNALDDFFRNSCCSGHYDS